MLGEFTKLNRAKWVARHSDPFGNSAPNENPASLGSFAYNLKFPGQYFDAETGNHYNYFRDYDPGIGRYLQSDPIGLWADLATYPFVSSDPLSGIDRLGLANSGLWKRVPGTTTEIRIDNPHVPGQQVHAHICTKGCPEIAVNKDGTGSHGTKDPKITNKKVKNFLRGKGFNIPGATGFVLGDIWDASQAFADYCALPEFQQKCVDVGLDADCGLFGT